MSPLPSRLAMLCVCAALHVQSAAAQLPARPATPGPTNTAAPDVTGVWIDHTGRGAIEITPCGARLCGYLYWVKDDLAKRGKPVVDSKNPDASRRNKPLCGTRILWDLQRGGTAAFGSVWGDGQIYNPEDGETYDAEIKLLSPNRLNVMGYAGVKFLSETYAWTRAGADLQRCGPPRI